VTRTVDAFLKNLDPVMELALIEAAAPPGLYFDPEKSRLILDPLIARDPSLRISSAEGTGSNREQLLWNSVRQTAQQLAQAGSPATAMDWLGRLPFADQSDYIQLAANVLNVWNLKSQTDAFAWLQNSGLNPTLAADLQKAVKP
jgi:hypothetical protein